MFVLGLTTMGDAAATLIADGQVIAAAEEERFSRVKHHVGFPQQATEFVLSEAGITLADVEQVGLYWKPWVLGRRAAVLLRSVAHSPAAFATRAKRGSFQVGGHYRQMFSMARHLRSRFGPSSFRFHYLDHHRTHAASCFHVSPFERAAILTIDGTGEAATCLMAVGEGNTIRELKRISLPHSLGQFYSAITNYLGFDMFAGDEWKVMGLAGWGEPSCYDFLIRNVLVPNGNTFRFNYRWIDHHLAKDYVFNSAFARAVGPPRSAGEEIEKSHRDLAASAQKVIEEVTLRLLQWLHDQTGERNLCMAGGVVFNSLMNGRLIRESPFEQFYFQPAAGDAGCSLGACYEIWNGQLKRPRSFVMEHAYWGPGFSDAECRAAIEAAGLPYRSCTDEELISQTVDLLAAGHIIAWFQGRMEWGPRALGNRSFLADPRDASVRDKLNEQVKLREWFRPLAPSLCEEHATAMFGQPHYDPFMLTVLPVQPHIKEIAPAIVHVDGTARPQTVRREHNARYWRLLHEFEQRTGVPCLLNTSFNIQEPIVCTPADAVNTFLKSRVLYLVLDRYIVTRPPSDADFAEHRRQPAFSAQY